MSLVFYLFLALLILISSFFSASETALFSLPINKIQGYKNAADPKNRIIYRLLSKPRELLVTILMFNILTNILVQNVSSSLFGHMSSWTWKVGFPLVLTLLFGEVIPKSLALPNNKILSRKVAPLISLLQSLTTPIRKFIIQVTTPISRLLFFFFQKEEDISKDELQHMLNTSEEGGIILKEESDLISGYLQLKNSSTKELMNPREDIIYYDIKEPLSKLSYLFVDRECTRIPVCEGNLDNILGIISAGQYFLHQNFIKEPEQLKAFLRKAFFVPENTPAAILLQQMERQIQTLAVVVDEYAAISGIITKEDLVEAVIGEIKDRRDNSKPLFTQNSLNSIISSGKLELLDFEKIFKRALHTENNMITIGGWLTERLGHIPKAGDKFEKEGFLFHILSAEPQKIKRVFIKLIPPKNKEGD
jgi:putative hemolysin